MNVAEAVNALAEVVAPTKSDKDKDDKRTAAQVLWEAFDIGSGWAKAKQRTGLRKPRSNPAKRRAKDAAYGGYKMTRAMWLRHARQAKLFVPWNQLTGDEKRRARNARKQERRGA